MIENLKVKEKLYIEKLENGLTVMIIPKKDIAKKYIIFGTNFGSIDNHFIMPGKNEEITIPDGVAHFLEHKLFEQENGTNSLDVLSALGVEANAYTTNDHTAYLFEATDHFYEALDELMNYVQNPYFTDENVEKEKGIIEEELNMYLDIPEFVLENKIRENLYQKHPRRIDVGGTVEDISKITKEDLYDCYHTFYQPNNMFALLVGNFSTEEALQIAREEIANRPNQNSKSPVGRTYHEPVEVTKKEETIYMNVKVPKVLFAVKFLRKKFPMRDKHMQNLYLQLITSVLFGSSSLFREEARKNGLMSGLYYGWEEVEDTISLIFQVDTKKPAELLIELQKTLSNIKITEEDMERYKKVWIANEVRLIDYVDATSDNVFTDIISYGDAITNRISLIRKMNKNDLEKVIHQFHLEHTASITVLPKEEQDAKESLDS